LNHIPTTATAVQKLKRLAKARRKTTGESLAAAQNEVARERGYRDWKHVTVCLETTGPTRPEPVLPESIRTFLAKQQAADPPQRETVEAMTSGLVFAMDIKDADNERPESNPEVHECEDATAVLAADIWLAMLRHEQEEGVEQGADLGPEDQVRDFIDYIGNYRFFRYSGPLVFSTLDDAFSGPLRDFFSPPTHIWLAGKLFGMADVAEIRVDGNIVYSRTLKPGGQSVSVYLPPAQLVPSFSSSPSDGFVVARLDVRKLQPNLYDFVASYSGQQLFSDAGFSSIADALRGAADVTGAVQAFEVAYGGLVAGTSGAKELAATADAVADRAVLLASSLGRQAAG
jgi:hypothetical protein